MIHSPKIKLGHLAHWPADQQFSMRQLLQEGVHAAAFYSEISIDLNYIDEKAIGYSGDDTVVKDFTIYGYADTGAQSARTCAWNAVSKGSDSGK